MLHGIASTDRFVGGQFVMAGKSLSMVTSKELQRARRLATRGRATCAPTGKKGNCHGKPYLATKQRGSTLEKEVEACARPTSNDTSSRILSPVCTFKAQRDGPEILGIRGMDWRPHFCDVEKDIKDLDVQLPLLHATPSQLITNPSIDATKISLKRRRCENADEPLPSGHRRTTPDASSTKQISAANTVSLTDGQLHQLKGLAPISSSNKADCAVAPLRTLPQFAPSHYPTLFDVPALTRSSSAAQSPPPTQSMPIQLKDQQQLLAAWAGLLQGFVHSPAYHMQLPAAGAALPAAAAMAQLLPQAMPMPVLGSQPPFPPFAGCGVGGSSLHRLLW